MLSLGNGHAKFSYRGRYREWRVRQRSVPNRTRAWAVVSLHYFYCNPALPRLSHFVTPARA